MKLLMENWKRFLCEDRIPGNEEVIAYHASPKRFEKFSMDKADRESHSGVGLFFMEDPALVRRGKYIYKVKLNLRDGDRYGSGDENDNTDINFQYDYDHDGSLVYKMLNHDDIEILDVTKK
tara:strand:- start:83 stop:445 length:363 start_codon:yes stop_codon:yes gene_type:complete